MRGDSREIIGIMIHIVTVGRLRRTPVTPTVMRDDAKAVVQEKHHLGVPIVRAQRPAVREDDWLALAPVFVIDLRTVFGRYHAHVGRSSGSGRMKVRADSPDSYCWRTLSLQLGGPILSVVHVRSISPAECSMSGDKLGLRMTYPWRSPMA